MDEQKQIEELKKKLYQERFISPDLGERAKNVRYEYNRLHRHVDYNKEENYRTSPRKPPASAGGMKGDEFPEIKSYL